MVASGYGNPMPGLQVHPPPGDPSDRAPGLAPDEVLARVELEIAQLLRRAEGARSARGSTSSDLDRSGYLILHDLVVNGSQNVNVLAAHLGLDASTITRQVVCLERAGRVRRTRDPLDGRAVVVESTDTGLDDLERHRADRADLYGRVLGGWSRLDRALLAELLERLNDDLDAYRRRPG